MQAMNEHPENQLNEGIRLYVVTTNNAMHHAYLSWVYYAVFVFQMFPNSPKKMFEDLLQRLISMQGKISLNSNWMSMRVVNLADHQALNLLTSLEHLCEQRVSQLHIMIGGRSVHAKSISFGQMHR